MSNHYYKTIQPPSLIFRFKYRQPTLTHSLKTLYSPCSSDVNGILLWFPTIGGGKQDTGILFFFPPFFEKSNFCYQCYVLGLAALASQK